jgi:hypothetical protein
VRAIPNRARRASQVSRGAAQATKKRLTGACLLEYGGRGVRSEAISAGTDTYQIFII